MHIAKHMLSHQRCLIIYANEQALEHLMLRGNLPNSEDITEPDFSIFAFLQYC